MTFLFLLIIKHVVIDLGVQSHYPGVWDKRSYIANGHMHYLQHAVGTLLVAWLCFDLLTACVLAIADYIVHWHIDWGKHQVCTRFNVPAKSLTWWWINVLDQSLHFTTYYVFALSVV